MDATRWLPLAIALGLALLTSPYVGLVGTFCVVGLSWWASAVLVVAWRGPAKPESLRPLAHRRVCLPSECQGTHCPVCDYH